MHLFVFSENARFGKFLDKPEEVANNNKSNDSVVELEIREPITITTSNPNLSHINTLNNLDIKYNQDSLTKYISNKKLDLLQTFIFDDSFTHPNPNPNPRAILGNGEQASSASVERKGSLKAPDSSLDKQLRDHNKPNGLAKDLLMKHDYSNSDAALGTMAGIRN
ncbi:24661_t:CDS:2 [Gigaspora rosea]|nr:24661_t:CDS:2 [Gigaspora rosea]